MPSMGKRRLSQERMMELAPHLYQDVSPSSASESKDNSNNNNTGLILTTKLFQTASSTIYKGCLGKKHVIVKCVRTGLRESSHEVDILERMQCVFPNADYFMRLLHVSYDTAGWVMFALEPGGLDLFEMYKKLGDDDIARGRLLSTHMYHCLYALKQMHRYGFVHNDIKPENIVLFNQDGVAFIDFADALHINVDDTVHINDPTGRVKTIHDRKHFGTDIYRHPKLVAHDAVDLRVTDLYSLGITCFCLFADTQPFDVNRHTKEQQQMIRHSFVQGTWLKHIKLPNNLESHFLFQPWTQFVSRLCSGQFTPTELLLEDPFLQYSQDKIASSWNTIHTFR